MNEQELKEKVMVIAGGNFGALRIAMEVASKYGVDAFRLLLASGIRKENLWMLYKDQCNEDYAAMFVAIANEEFSAHIVRISDEHTANFQDCLKVFVDTQLKMLKEMLETFKRDENL